MTSLQVLKLVCTVIVVAVTLIGVGLFARACSQIVARMRLGRAAGRERTRPVGRRLWLLVSEVLGHSAFKGRPWIRVAH